MPWWTETRAPPSIAVSSSSSTSSRYETGNAPGRDERVTAAELPPLDAGQSERDTLAGARALDRGVVHLHAADANLAAARARPRSTSPSAIVPDQSVPVTTVPIPCSVKTRST